jgi:hypothetical protein
MATHDHEPFQLLNPAFRVLRYLRASQQYCSRSQSMDVARWYVRRHGREKPLENTNPNFKIKQTSIRWLWTHKSRIEQKNNEGLSGAIDTMIKWCRKAMYNTPCIPCIRTQSMKAALDNYRGLDQANHSTSD